MGATLFFWEIFAGAILLTFGGRFEGHFEFIFGYVSSHFRRLRRALGVLLRLSRNDFERLSDHFDVVIV